MIELLSFLEQRGSVCL